jgi:hypothetical protein
MTRTLISFFLAITLCNFANSQTLTGNELLEKAISYHDPNGNWATFNGQLNITMKMPDGSVRLSEIKIDLPRQFFQVNSTKDRVQIQRTVNKGQCELQLNGSSAISEEEQKKHRLSCDNAKMYRDYYTYLYGLPMKLKDPGTIIHSKTQRKTFKGKEYVVLKVAYEKEVGDDIWYFYFDPNSYAMEVYQFFHEEAKNDGEYILLSEIEEVSNIKIPKVRTWYYNEGDELLGTDFLTSGKSL